eukprot:c32795_g1_i1.p1 GENE.c32795_g1_i1~~c32795_g1_i1.p1  ORF type:complete len:311 (+),score=72.81 c32795_g1_i1:48-935(+)
MAELIDGKRTADSILEALKVQAVALQQEHGVVPGISVIIVGGRTDSATYVRMKKKAATNCGFNSDVIEFPETITEAELLAKIDELNNDPTVHGILVQLPLPEHINPINVQKAVLAEKDVDGFSAYNVGNLAMNRGSACFAMPCTPKGCIELLRRYNVPIEGRDAVVVGRSNIVGMPVALMLMAQGATVTICHSKTVDVAAHVRRADIVVAAIGRAAFIKADWIKPGAVVIDVGINSVPDSSPKGYRLVGDVDPDAAKFASKITPVPGGVGPMTIAMLMLNTLNLARHSIGLEPWE